MITVYTKENCQQCRMVKKFLKDHNVKFEEVDAGSVKGRAKVIDYGFRSLPLTVADEFEPFVGLDMTKLKQIVGEGA